MVQQRCQQGFKRIEDRCVKVSSGSNGLGKQVAQKTVEGFSAQQIAGIFLLFLAFFLPNIIFKKTVECPWWNLFCHAGSVTTGLSSNILTIALAGLGIYMIAIGSRK